MTLAGRRVVLGVSGGIACYKACTIARRLTEMRVAVDVVLTRAAAEFVGPITFEALTHRPVLTSLWQRGAALAHVESGQNADLIILAPATANLIARAAQGIADDVLSALLMARTAPVLIAPAMNDEMFAHTATKQNLQVLRDGGWAIVGPDIGPLAEGASDRPGRMSEPEVIVAEAERMIRGADGKWRGKHVTVTAGPTREAIDPVRVITNRSSGRMGFALAEAAYARGADVTLIAGPTALPLPHGVKAIVVDATSELEEAVRNALPDTDVLIMAAAPADFRPTLRAGSKLPRGEGALEITLEPTADVLQATRDKRKQGSLSIGFALETSDGVRHAREKLDRKALDMIVLNMANEPGAGFEVETNAVTIVTASNTTSIPQMPKREVADRLLEAAEELF
ncbi:MAG: bifunctional phosphopantothenoylcysteine decarboxylase/phosphopantothenate--cysteine ligase CoaBC [Gemmatimonadetes bacterium]|nr:bifunctional phosphopantothenoylcysteine decarboxylase/phosphopantothenate--cysteine ligase CoaBC [Gemmatimonadota bacterium]